VRECFCGRTSRTPFSPRDVWYHNWQGAGGYGDPLERDPAAVLRDVHAGLVSPESARDIYGVVLSGDSADLAATSQRREAVRQVRVPDARLPADRPTPARGSLRYGEYVELDPETNRMWCGRCGHTLGRFDDDLRQAATRLIVPLTAAGPIRGEEYDRGRFHLELYCCPGCAVQLEADVVQVDGPRPSFRLTVS
jgi:N-methylhydantoinase B